MAESENNVVNKLITYVDLTTEEKDIFDASQPKETPQCSCGKFMEAFSKESCAEKKGRIRCYQCHFLLTKDQPFPYYFGCDNCPKFNLCQKCGEYCAHNNFSSQPLKHTHDIKKLYYVYASQILGPYTAEEVVQAYVERKFKNKIYLQNASGDTDWVKLVLPGFHREGLKEWDEKRCDMMKDCEEMNGAFKSKYPQLYALLIGNIFSGKVKKVRIPKNIPNEEQRKGIVQKIYSIIGKLLLYLIILWILLQCLPTSFAVLIYWSVCGCLRSVCKMEIKRDWTFNYISLVVGSVGIFITPIIIVWVCLYFEIWPEIQSWMVTYMIWGTLTFLTTSIVPYLTQKKKVKRIQSLMNIMFEIIGAHFGDHGFWTITGAYADGKNKSRLLLAFSYALFSLSALLPAAIAGFVANYILEEKFLLKCGEGTEKNLCFTNEITLEEECCEIISSHSATSFYSFVGGLTSSLIGTWAVVRIVGYLLLNAFPVFTIYAKRKRR